jgi:hypothetical protein
MFEGLVVIAIDYINAILKKHFGAFFQAMPHQYASELGRQFICQGSPFAHELQGNGVEIFIVAFPYHQDVSGFALWHIIGRGLHRHSVRRAIRNTQAAEATGIEDDDLIIGTF